MTIRPYYGQKWPDGAAPRLYGEVWFTWVIEVTDNKIELLNYHQIVMSEPPSSRINDNNDEFLIDMKINVQHGMSENNEHSLSWICCDHKRHIKKWRSDKIRQSTPNQIHNQGWFSQIMLMINKANQIHEFTTDRPKFLLSVGTVTLSAYLCVKHLNTGWSFYS